MIDRDTITSIATLAGVGGVAGFGKLLASGEKLTARIVIGRCLSSCGLGASAAAAVTVFPGLPFVAQLGIAAGLASLGTSALEVLFNKYFGTTSGGK